jgi:hypothetical protein
VWRFAHSCLPVTPHRKLNIKQTRTPLKERIKEKQRWTQKTNKQLWTNATPQTNRQTSVDKRHTENQQTNNCGQTSHRKPRLSTVVSLLVFCVAFVHSCFSVGFLCGVCPQLFLCWFSVWRLSTVVCLLENQQTNNCGQTPHRKPTDKQLWTNATQKTNHSCLSIGFLCDVCPQLFFYWFSVWRFSTVVSLLGFCVTFVHSGLSVGFLYEQTTNCGQTPHRKPTDKQLWTNATQKTNN